MKGEEWTLLTRRGTLWIVFYAGSMLYVVVGYIGFENVCRERLVAKEELCCM